MRKCGKYSMQWGFAIVSFLLIVFFFVVVSGCSPRIIEHTRIEYHDRIQVDTLIEKDSVRIKEYVKGDTVYAVEYRDHLIKEYKYIEKKDTVVQHDTTFVVRRVEVEKALTNRHMIKIGAFWYLVIACICLFVFAFRKQIMKLIK